MNKRKVLFMVIFAAFCVFTSYQSVLATEKTVKLETMKKALTDGGFPVEGDPQFLN